MSDATSSAEARPVPLAEAAGRSYSSTVPYTVSREKIAELAGAIGDPHPAYRDPDWARGLGHPDVVAPPTFAIVVVFGLLERMLVDPQLGLALHRVMHAEQAFTVNRPLHAGDQLTACLTIDRTRRMGDADLLFTRTEIATPDGEALGTAAATVVHQDGAAESREATSDAGDQPGPAPAATARSVPAYASVEPGAKLSGHVIPVRRVDLIRYAGASGDVNPIHWSDRVARQVGLPGVVAHGMVTMAYAGRVATDWVGDPGRVVEYATRFTKPVWVPDDDEGVGLTVGGTVGQLLDDHRVRLDLTAHVGSEPVLGRARAVVQLP